MQNRNGMVLTTEQHSQIIDEFIKHFATHIAVGPSIYTALLGHFLGRMQFYVTEGSNVPEEDFLKMIEENRKIGYTDMSQSALPKKH